MKKTTTRILMLTIFLSLTVSESLAQTRIKFAKGQTSTTISRIIPESSDDFFEWMFLLSGKAGQTITATVRSRTGKVHFTARGKSEIIRLKDSGEIFIALINDGRATQF